MTIYIIISQLSGSSVIFMWTVDILEVLIILLIRTMVTLLDILFKFFSLALPCYNELLT